jgi:hypothetical protein
MTKTKKQAQFVVKNCTFHTTPELDQVAIAKAEAVKELAMALGKAADVLRGAASDVTGLKITGS